MIYLWAIAIAVVAVAMETAARTGIDYKTFLLRGGLVGAIVLNFGLFSILKNSQSLLSGILIFSFFTLMARILSSVFVLDEPLRGANLVAALALGSAFVVNILWR